MKHVLVGILVLGAGSLGLSAQAPPAGKAATSDTAAKATVKLSRPPIRRQGGHLPAAAAASTSSARSAAGVR